MKSGRFTHRRALFVLIIASAAPAYGYTDPGSGALLYQMLVAGFLTGGFYFRRVLDKLWRKRK